MENDESIEKILDDVAALLEEHSKILLSHRQMFEQLFKQTAALNRKIDQLKSADSLNSSNAKFIADMTARLKTISDALEQKT
jgi:hypothetical protein